MKKNWHAMHVAKLIVPLTFLASCVKMDESLAPPADTTNALGVTSPSDFNYATTADVSVDVTLLTNDNQPLQNVMVKVLDAPSDENGTVLFTAITDASGKINSNIKIPSYLKTVVVDAGYIGLMRNANVRVTGAGITATIGGSEGFAGNVVPVLRTAATTAVGVSNGRTAAIPYHYMGTYSSTGKPNYLEPVNDVITAKLLSYVNASLPEQKPVPDYHPAYLKDNATTNVKLLQTSDIWITFVHEGAGYQNTLGYFTYPSNTPPTSTNDIDSIHIILPNGSLSGSGGSLTSGNKVRIGRFAPGTSVGFCLIANGWSDQTKVVGPGLAKYWSIDALNPETSISKRRHTVLLRNEEDHLVLAGFEDQNRDQASDNDFNDMIFYVTSNPVDGISYENMNPIDKPGDKDGDGVSDVYDEFPTDPLRAYTNAYPSATGFGTIAFEDTWPDQGDYDMNDLVVDYRYTSVQNAQNKTLELFSNYVLKASGAQFKNGFGVQFPFAPTAVTSVTGSKVNSTNVVTLNPKGLEAGQTKAVVIPFDNIFSLMSPTSDKVINTEKGTGFITPDTIKMKMTFTTPLTFAQLGVAPFNQFLISNKTRGREVHLPGEVPTDKVSTSLFNTLKDNTIPSQNRYFKTKNNLPFAISVPQSFEYPIEGKVISSAYLKFVTWAQSGGVSMADWYKNNTGYRLNSMIYK